MPNGSVSRTCCPNPPHAAQTQGGLLNARRSLARAGSSRCMLLTDFDSWPTVYWRSRRIIRRLLLRTMYYVAVILGRE
ncbi:hypothetical protein MPEAHAMD_5828 [Methylobacterium frigidaeris]|uniref:Uncharacterized protein n=1 Tax=Methylobacterium frigidaeris TaxID=2038277 RepID=A0AA37M744_9HYPH|nr:hypothetical protein MPEAHAMD_5828 [Methylobacterium frigidaeris]